VGPTVGGSHRGWALPMEGPTTDGAHRRWDLPMVGPTLEGILKTNIHRTLGEHFRSIFAERLWSIRRMFKSLELELTFSHERENNME